MLDYSDFKIWLDKNDCLNKNFSLMQEVVTEYLLRKFEDPWEHCDWPSVICRELPTVISRCDEITYNEPGVPEAYIILHFLDRYHRFQLIFLDMLENGLFPIRETIDVMDIGTGPGPSLFALSDMILLINLYLGEKGKEKGILFVNLDYAEQSDGFRDFMHHVAELLLSKGHKTFVPFHHGTYHDAATFQSGEKKLIYVDAWKVMASPDEEDYFRVVPKYVPYKRAFNMVIYSNFLTNINVVDLFQEQLKKTMFYMRNRGVLVIVGGNPADEKYFATYKRIDQVLCSQRYANKQYGGWYKQKAKTKMMSYSADSEYNKAILRFFKQMFGKIPKEEWNKIDEKTKTQLERFLKGTKDTSWYVSIYERYSFLRRFRKKDSDNFNKKEDPT